MRAALYARFSSDNQKYESIQAQLRCSREYCKAKGYKVVKVYTDEAISGTSIVGREAFQQMILDSADGIFDVIVFHKIDRAARNEIDYYTNISRLQKHGIGYEYSAEGIDVTTANGKLTEGIKVAVAAWYSRNLSLEVIKGKKETALKSLHNGGSAPLGYDVVDQKYVINEYEAAAVRQIFKMRSQGSGYGPIIDWLNSHGYKTKRGGSFGKNSLHDILCNKKYIGTYVYNRTSRHNSHKLNPDVMELPNTIPAIIDTDLFYSVQPSGPPTGRNKAKVIYALSGKIFCSCGSSMTGYSSGGRYHYYVCHNQTYKRLPCDCPKLKKEFIERKILELVLNECKAEEVLKEFEKLSRVPDKRKELLAQQIKKLEQKLDKLIDLYADTGTKSVADKYKEGLEKLSALKKEHSDISIAEVDMKAVSSFLNNITTMDFDDESMRDLFRSLVNKVIVSPGSIEIDLSFRINNSVVALKRTMRNYLPIAIPAAITAKK